MPESLTQASLKMIQEEAEAVYRADRGTHTVTMNEVWALQKAIEHAFEHAIEEGIVQVHLPDCPRHAHGGPCKSALRFELPETPEEEYQRHVNAVKAVLTNRLDGNWRVASDKWLTETAEQVIAAAEVGF